MSLTATYDPVLSRVRLTASALEIDHLTETFPVLVSNGWGTSTSGHPWSTAGGAASDYHTVNLSGNIVGRVDLTLASGGHYTSAGSFGGVDLRGTVRVQATATGGAIVGGFVARYADIGNHYFCQIVFATSGSTTVQVFKRVATVSTAVTSSAAGPAYTPGAPLNLRLYVVADRIKAKLWTGSEPAAWSVEGIDSTFAAGAVGTYSSLGAGNTNTPPVFVDYDNLDALAPVALVDVEHSLNLIRWTSVRGGNDLPAAPGSTLLVDDYEFADSTQNYYRARVFDEYGSLVSVHSTSITPALDTVWIKSLSRPFLNRAVTVTDVGEIERGSRGGVFEVLGRSLPVAVADVRGSRRYTLEVMTTTLADADDLDGMLASGDPVLVHTPIGCGIPAMYAVIGDTTQARKSTRGVRRYFSLPLTEIAAPGSDVVGATVNWQSILSSFVAWQSLVAGEPTWQDVLERIGTPADVITP